VIRLRRIKLGQLGSSAVIAFAVSELQRYLKQMDPQIQTDVLTAESPDAFDDTVLWIGRNDRFTSSLPAVKDPALDDAISISVKDNAGFITGTNDRSVLIAVYRFLRELGCSWVRPSEEGERIPQKTLESFSVHLSEAASRRHRGVCIEGAVSYENVRDMIDYLPKIGMNEYFVQFLVPGVFFKRWYEHNENPHIAPEKISRTEIEALTASLEAEISRRGLSYHKTGHGWTCEPFGIEGSGWFKAEDASISEETRKYLAEISGTRSFWKGVPLNTNLCYSNPEVRKKMTHAITAYCQKNPHVDVLHFWLADGSNNQCECSACQAKRPADWYMLMLNELDEKMTAAGVDTKIVFLIYVDLLWEPQEYKLNNPDRFILMFAPITRSYSQNYGEALVYDEELPPYTRNRLAMPSSLAQNLAHLRRWQENFSGDSFSFDYHLMWVHMGDPGYEKSARNLFRDMQDLPKIGLNGMLSCQVQRCFFPTAMPFNMMAAALWDESADFDKKADAYYTEAFGEDGLELRSHMCAISDLFLMFEGPSHGIPEKMERGPFCKDYSALSSEITAIRALTARNVHKPSMYRKDWEYMPIYCEYLTLLSLALQARENGAEDEFLRIMRQLMSMLQNAEPQIQKAADIRNFHVTLGRRFKITF